MSTDTVGRIKGYVTAEEICEYIKICFRIKWNSSSRVKRSFRRIFPHPYEPMEYVGRVPDIAGYGFIPRRFER